MLKMQTKENQKYLSSSNILSVTVLCGNLAIQFFMKTNSFVLCYLKKNLHIRVDNYFVFHINQKKSMFPNDTFLSLLFLFQQRKATVLLLGLVLFTVYNVYSLFEPFLYNGEMNKIYYKDTGTRVGHVVLGKSK